MSVAKAASTMGEAAQRRREALGPWAAAVVAALPPAGTARLPDSICAGGRGVDVGAWEKSVLRSAVPADGSPDEMEALVVDGLAYQAKCRETVERIDHLPLPGPEELPAFIENLVCDAAVGLALQRELQRQVDELVRAGRTAEAKGLTGFRNRIARVSSRLAEIVEGEHARRAESLAEAMVGETAGRLRPLTAGPLVEGGLALPTPTHAAKRPPTPSGRTIAAAAAQSRLPLKLVVPVLVILGAVAVWLNAGPLLSEPSLPALGLSEFKEIGAVSAVVARPPSLFVTIDGPAWDALDKTDRRRLLEEVARVVEGSGYLGLQIRTTSGQPVGQWSMEHGVKSAPEASGAT